MLQPTKHDCPQSGLENGILDGHCPLLAQSRHNWYRTENVYTVHSTRATPVRAVIRHTWRVSADCVSLSAVVDDPVVVVVVAAASSASLASNTTSNAAVCAPRLWLMARRNCSKEYDPRSFDACFNTSIVLDVAFYGHHHHHHSIRFTWCKRRILMQFRTRRISAILSSTAVFCRCEKNGNVLG